MIVRRLQLCLLGLVVLLGASLWPGQAAAMHIADGILPPAWVGCWWLVSTPALGWGLWSLRRRYEEDAKARPLIGLIGAAVFLVSCLPIPVPFTGTCSHPCGTGLAAILLGPGITVVITAVALVLQALFLAHGGLTTLGADTVSMGLVGGLVGWAAFSGLRGIGARATVAAFAAGLLSDWATYATTAVQLGFGLAAAGESPWRLSASVILAFAPLQIPLGIVEGILCAGAWKFIAARRPDLLPSQVPSPPGPPPLMAPSSAEGSP